MKKNLLISIFCLVISACSSINSNPQTTLVSSIDREKQTIYPTTTPQSTTKVSLTPTFPPTQTQTHTPTQTQTQTHTPTQIPTITPTLTSTFDLSIIGKPEKPFISRRPKPVYNEKNYEIYQQIIHGRKITVAWEKEAKISIAKQQEISDFYFQTFSSWWEIFGGFPYDSYTVVMKKSANNQGETGVGYEETASTYSDTLDWHLKERITHEVFHAWVGNAICDKDVKKFDEGLWFREGITQYYGDRGSGEAGYQKWMREHYKIYKDRILGTEMDIPIFDMPEKSKAMGESVTGSNRNYRLNVYWKGALIAYMIDLKLQNYGQSLDDYLKYLYETYSLKQQCFTTTQAKSALNKISGDDWADFFDAYIFGTEPLPLDGNFEFLDH